MITGYVDESGHSAETPFVSMAAFVAQADVWREFDAQWNAALETSGAPYLHMRELAHFRGAFSGWSEDRRRGLIAAAVEAINVHRLVAVGAAISVQAFRALPAEAQEGFRDPFFCCLQEMAYGLVRCADDPPRVRCKAVFSQQNEFRPTAERLWQDLRQRPGFAERLGDIEFANMRTSPGLQAADLLAYELRHFYHLRAKQPGCKPRWPFEQIVAFQRTHLHAGMLRYLPGWYLELRWTGAFEQTMTELMRQPDKFEARLTELSPDL
jgi:hypothetical protein